MGITSLRPLPGQPVVMGVNRFNRFLFDAENFRVKMLGKGGTAAIFEARGRFAKKYAIKIAEGARAEYIENEAQALAVLKHPNIIKCYAHGEAGNKQFLVLEHFQGRNLQVHIRNRYGQPLTLLEVFAAAEQVAEALGYMHEQGWVHTDVKPENILFNRQTGQVKLIDFSFARPEGHRIRGETEERFAHTPGYVSSARVRGLPPSSAEDVYQLGITVYNMLARDTREFSFWQAQQMLLDLHLPSLLKTSIKDAIMMLLLAMTGSVPVGRFSDFDQTLPVIRAIKEEIKADEFASQCPVLYRYLPRP